MIPCGACESSACGSCLADKMEMQGTIRDAAFHCGCSANGHKDGKMVTREIPKVKSMFSKVKDEDNHVEREVVEE